MTRDATIARFREATKNIKTGTTIALWTSFSLSAGLLIASFVVPPTGIIDGSVLKAASLIFGFAGLFFLREAVMEEFGWLGIKIDKEINNCKGKELVISTPDSKVTVVVIPTDEELMIASDTMSLL